MKKKKKNKKEKYDVEEKDEYNDELYKRTLKRSGNMMKIRILNTK